jgi:hypothetical protein
LFCLIFPSVKTEKSTENIPSKVIQTTTWQQTVSSVYTFSNYNSQYVQAIKDEQTLQAYPVFKILHPLILLKFQTKDGLFHVQFSRPPPTLEI